MTKSDVDKDTDVTNVFYGHFGGYNAGDELILETFREIYSKNKDFKIICVSKPKYGYRQGQGETTDIYSYFSFLRNIFRFRGSNFIVAGGQTASGDRNLISVLKLLLFIMLGKLIGNKVLIIGVGFYRLEVLMTKLICSLSVVMADYCSVRDERSLSVLYVWARKNAVFRTDIVFANKDIVNKDGRPVENYKDIRKVGLFLHYSKYRSFNSFEYYNDIIKLLVNMNYRVVLFCHENRKDYDRYYVDVNLEILKKNDIDYVVFNSDVKEILDLYSDLDLVMSARMHPLIVSLVKKIRCVCVGGSSKVQNFSVDAGIAVLSKEDISEDSLITKVFLDDGCSLEYTEINSELGQLMIKESLYVLEG